MLLHCLKEYFCAHVESYLEIVIVSSKKLLIKYSNRDYPFFVGDLSNIPDMTVQFPVFQMWLFIFNASTCEYLISFRTRMSNRWNGLYFWQWHKVASQGRSETCILHLTSSLSIMWARFLPTDGPLICCFLYR